VNHHNPYQRAVIRLAGGLLAGWMGLLGLVAPAAAEDRALLVGVGKYRNPGANLDGIQLDLAMMQEVATLLGFRQNQIKVIQDEQATLSNVEQAIGTWLTQGVAPEDQVLFYFSGHGAQIPDENGDEADGADEVLVMHDVEVVQRNGRASLANVLVDDRFNELLVRIPSQHILVMVDACHSGTATKSVSLSPRGLGETEGMFKFYYYPSMPVTAKSDFSISEQGDRPGYVALAAARDDEQAITTRQGSIFTLGLRQSIREGRCRPQRPDLSSA